MIPSVAMIGAVLGLVIGSFLNVVIYRVPRGLSLISPGSRCPACGTGIRARDNVPLVSYMFLMGRCRSCSTPISLRYPIVEATTAALWSASALRFGSTEEALFVAVAGSVLIALSVIDLERRRIPNVIVLPSIVVGAAWIVTAALFRRDPSIVTTSVLGASAGFTLLFLIAIATRGMGFGDVKLVAFVGLVSGRFGWEVFVLSLFVAFGAGGLVATAFLVVGRLGRKDALPFGPALAFGALAACFAGVTPVRSWLGL